MSLIMTKLAFFSFPLLRQARGIQKALEATAMPGPFGFLVDIIKMAWGEFKEFIINYITTQDA